MTSLLSGPSMSASTHSTAENSTGHMEGRCLLATPLPHPPYLQMDGTSPLLHRGHQVWTVEYRSVGPAPTKPYTLLLASDPVPIASGSRSFLLAQCRVATHRIASMQLQTPQSSNLQPHKRAWASTVSRTSHYSTAPGSHLCCIHME